MRKFDWREVEEAVGFAAGGGQALHCHQIIVDPARAPQCFVRAVARGEQIGHLFDQDAVRLVATARRLGVRVIRIDRLGTAEQHIDLCGGPMRRALAECEEVPADD